MHIEVYGKSMCSACDSVTLKLDLLGVPYQYHLADALTSDELSWVISECGSGEIKVPIIFIDGKVVTIDEFNQYFESQRATPTRMD